VWVGVFVFLLFFVFFVSPGEEDGTKSPILSFCYAAGQARAMSADCRLHPNGKRGSSTSGRRIPSQQKKPSVNQENARITWYASLLATCLV